MGEISLKWHFSRCLEYLRIPNGSFIQCFNAVLWCVEEFAAPVSYYKMTIVCSHFSIKSNLQWIIFVGSESPFACKCQDMPWCSQLAPWSWNTKIQVSRHVAWNAYYWLFWWKFGLPWWWHPSSSRGRLSQGITRVSAMAKFSSQQLQGAAFLWQVQWLHSFYFVLTVFTTVGFGVSRPFSEQMQWAANRFADDLFFWNELSILFYLISRFWRMALVS